MMWLFPIFLLAFALVMLAFVFHIHRDFSAQEKFNHIWFKRWLLRGVAVPIVLWTLMSLGQTSVLPPLTRHIATLKYGGHAWVAAWEQMTVAALFVVCWWTVLTFGWFLLDLCKRAKNVEDLIVSLLIWSPLLLIFGWLCLGLGLSGEGFVLFFWVCPVTQYLVVTAHFANPTPTYSRAIGKIKFGKYREAEMAIISELEKCENDFDGWMMLAELYASQFHDLDEAERAIYDLCCEPATSLSQVSIALHKLADWHLHYGNDAKAARRALEDICTRMPGTHLATMARNRINHLPTDAELAQKDHPKPVKMPVIPASLAETAIATLDHAPAQNAADGLVARLNENPDDVAAREKLARIFAVELGQNGIGIDQLDLLVNMPGQPDAKMAEWLGLKANWQSKVRGEAAAKETLERLVHEFPQSPQAFDAQRRLSLLQYHTRKTIVPITVRPPQHDDEE